MIARGTICYPTYRDVRDALLASSRKPSAEYLLVFLADRGIFISNDLSRDEIVEEISMRKLSFNDFEELLNLIEVHARNEKSEFKSINNSSIDLNAIKINELTNKLQDKREKNGEIINVETDSSGKIYINVNYVEFDYGKTPLRQRQEKEAKIEIIKEKGFIKFRYPANERLRDVVGNLLGLIEDENEEDIQIKEIDLSNFSREKRTLFFRELMRSLEGYNFEDVIKVGLENKANDIGFTEDQDNEDAEGLEEIEKETMEAKAKSFLKKASLDGEGLLHSEELRSFLDSGFYFSRVVWIVINSKEKVALEALMENPVEGKNYKYSVRGIFPMKRNREGYAKNVRQPTPEDRRRLSHLLENASYKTYEKILNFEETES